MSGRYGSRTTHSSNPQYRKILFGEIEEALEYYKTQGAFVRSIPIWKDQHGNQYTLIQITDRHLDNLIPFLERRRSHSMAAKRRDSDMLHMMKIERQRRKDIVGNIDLARELMRNNLEL